MTKVIIVDDSREATELIFEALQNISEVEVIGYVDKPADVLKTIDTYRPEIITLDINMPELEGVKLLQEIRRDYPEVLVVVVSGELDTKVLDEMAKENPVGFVQKPFQPGFLETQVNKALAILEEREEKKKERKAPHPRGHPPQDIEEPKREKLLIYQPVGFLGTVFRFGLDEFEKSLLRAFQKEPEEKKRRYPRPPVVKPLRKMKAKEPPKEEVMTPPPPLPEEPVEEIGTAENDFDETVAFVFHEGGQEEIPDGEEVLKEQLEERKRLKTVVKPFISSPTEVQVAERGTLEDLFKVAISDELVEDLQVAPEEEPKTPTSEEVPMSISIRPPITDLDDKDPYRYLRQADDPPVGEDSPLLGVTEEPQVEEDKMEEESALEKAARKVSRFLGR